jgi:alpha-beta hydrolase superfamily lysophospholipase
LNATYEEPRTPFEWLCKDEKIVDKYIEDPLCGYAYSKMFYKEFFHAMIDVNKSDVILETNDIPMLFISGKDDPVGDFGEGVKRTRELYSGHGYTQLTIKLVDNNRHEIINEKEKIATYKYLLEWISSNI